MDVLHMITTGQRGGDTLCALISSTRGCIHNSMPHQVEQQEKGSIVANGGAH